MKETSFTCSLVINLIQKKLLVVLECLKDRAFDSEVSCGILTKVCKVRLNYLRLSCFTHNPITV